MSTPDGPLPSPEPIPGRSRTLPFGPLVGGIVSVVVGIVLVVFLVNQLSGVDTADPSGGTPSASPTPEHQESQGPGGSADVLSAAGLRDLLDAIRQQTGTTQVFDATLYPAYAVLQLPEDRETLRQQYFYWDGKTLASRDSFGRSSSPRIDLASIEAEAMLRLLRLARKQVEEPNSWYIIVNAPDESDKAVMYAYASNKYTEGGYISAEADGTVVRKVTW
ncbi:MAG TPA: hypothetical protein VLI04_21110 [Nocardioidaceae bacterium]|nr:hypothetical protein [Nocardioidaceae bacterium]